MRLIMKGSLECPPLSSPRRPYPIDLRFAGIPKSVGEPISATLTSPCSMIVSNCSEIRSGYRKMNIGSHVVFLRQRRSDEIEIVRILHCRMDFEARLPSDQN